MPYASNDQNHIAIPFFHYIVLLKFSSFYYIFSVNDKHALKKRLFDPSSRCNLISVKFTQVELQHVLKWKNCFCSVDIKSKISSWAWNWNTVQNAGVKFLSQHNFSSRRHFSRITSVKRHSQEKLYGASGADVLPAQPRKNMSSYKLNEKLC